MIDDLVLMIVGFILTGVCGKYFTSILSKKSWIKQTKYSLFKSEYDEGKAVIDDLSDMIGSRLFTLEMALSKNDSEEICELVNVNAIFDDEWDEQVFKIRSKLKYFLGEDYASRFYCYNDEYAFGNPESLHFMFINVYTELLNMCRNDTSERDVKNKVATLKFRSSAFIEDINSEFMSRANHLKLLD